jgi:hypothetical protein
LTNTPIQPNRNPATSIHSAPIPTGYFSGLSKKC